MMKKFVATFILLFILAGPAQAHTSLVSAVPAADSTVVDFPMEVVLNFNEELLIVGDENPNKVEVFDSQGALVSGSTVVKGGSIAAPVGIVGNGAFTVQYRVVSKDGHVVEGSYVFNVESPIAIASPAPISAPEETAEDGSNLLVRLVELLVIGGLGFAVFISLRKANSLFGSRPR